LKNRGGLATSMQSLNKPKRVAAARTATLGQSAAAAKKAAQHSDSDSDSDSGDSDDSKPAKRPLQGGLLGRAGTAGTSDRLGGHTALRGKLHLAVNHSHVPAAKADSESSSGSYSSSSGSYTGSSSSSGSYTGSSSSSGSFTGSSSDSDEVAAPVNRGRQRAGQATLTAVHAGGTFLNYMHH